MHEPITVVSRPAGGHQSRMCLWIDGIGGFLICLGPRVSIGNPAGGMDIDVPIHADLSRHHASLQREGSQYVLEAVRKVKIGERSIDKALLQNNDRFTLGTTCQVRFSQPVPVSASARLDILSGHRLPLALDAALLMADTLVLGRGPQAHVEIPDLAQEMVLFRQKDGLALRHSGAFQVAGKIGQEKTPLEFGQTVTTEQLSFTLESLEAAGPTCG